MNNPVRTGSAVLLLLPYVLFVGGVLAAAKLGGTPNGTVPTIEALSVAAIGLLWTVLRHRRKL
jgi:hypothetical protein